MDNNLTEDIKIEQLHTEFTIKMEKLDENTEDNINSSSHSNDETEKLFSCNVCGKTFNYNSYLIIHKRTHTGEKPFTCNVCGKTFSDSSHLIRHNRTHTGEKPFTCDVCGKTFRTSSCLIRHNRTHSGEKPFSCDVCMKTFKSKYSLDRHKQIHGVELNTKQLIKIEVKSEALMVMSEEHIKLEQQKHSEFIIKDEPCESDSQSMEDPWMNDEIDSKAFKIEQQ